MTIVAISAGVAWYARSGLVRWLAIRQLGALTNRQVTIEGLEIDPLRGRLLVSGFRLADRAPGPPLAEIERIDVRFDPLALLRARLVIREAALGGVRARIVRSGRGELNIADLLAPGPARRGSADLTIDRVTLAGGEVLFEDRARTPVHTWRADGIGMELSHISTTRSDTQGAARITASVAGSPVSAEISQLRLTPLHFRGRLALKDMDATLADIALPADISAIFERARLTADLDVSVDARGGIGLDASGRLDELGVGNRRTGKPMATVPSLAFTVNGAHADASGGAPRLGRVEITGSVTLFDARGGAAGRFEINRVRLQIADVEGSAPASARANLSAGLPGGGSLEVQGPLRLAPFGAELRIRVARLDPAVLMSYLDLPLILSGLLESDLTVSAAYSGALAARIAGRTVVSRATVADGERQVASARQIEVEGFAGEMTGARRPKFSIARVRVLQPVAIVERDQAGRLALADRFASPPTAPGKGAAPTTAESTQAPTTVEVAEIFVDDGAITVSDAGTVPAARLTLSKLRGSARDLAWPPRRPVAIALQAATPGAGRFEAKGKVSLDPLRLDVRARLDGAALAPYQAYVPFPARIQGSVHADLAVVATLAPKIEVTAKGTAGFSELAFAEGERRVLRVSKIETTGLEYAWPATVAIDRLRVGRSRATIERRADGAFPLRELLTPARTPDASAAQGAAAARGGPAISVTVREAILENGSARIVDETVKPASRVDLSGVRVVAQGFTWPARRPMPIELRVGVPGGGSVSARGSLDVASKGAELKVTLAGVDLAPGQPYLPLSARIDGKASGDLDVEARLEPLSIAVRGKASLADLAVADGGGPALTAAGVEATGLDYTWPAKVGIDRLRVQKPRAVVERRRDGALSLLALFTPPSAVTSATTTRPGLVSASAAPPKGAAVPPLEVSIRESVLEGGSVALTDAAVSPPARFEVAGVRFVARDFTWPSRGPTSLRLRAPMPGGGSVSARGQLAGAPAGLDLDVTLDGVDVASARPYLPLRGQIAGKASAKLKVNVTMEPLALTARGTAALADLTVTSGQQQLLTAAHAEVTGLDYTWPATVNIDRLRVQKPWAVIDRVSGKLPLLDALVPPLSPAHGAAQRSGSAAGAAPVPLRFTIRRSAIEDGAATIVDASVSPPGRLEITGARATLRDLAWPARGPSRFVLRASTPAGGAVEARGHLRLDPPSIDTKLVLVGIDLAPFQPFVATRARIAGTADVDLQVKGPLAPLALSITGQVAVTDASLGDGDRPLATAKRLEVAGIVAEWPRRRATVERIFVREPWALVERDASGNLPLLALIRPEPTDGMETAAPSTRSATAPTTRAANLPSIEVAALVVEEGFIRFTDRTTKPAFVEEASRLAVTARGVGTAPATRSQLSVGASLTGGGQLELGGTMGPLGGPLFVDISGKLSGLALNRVNPYVNGLLGWIARQGSVGATTHFRIRDDQLEAENEVVIGQPQLVPSRRGDEVRKRVGVPLDLLISLLENTRNEVHLSVPVTGTISSRRFDFGDAVWDAIRKAAINVLALPVSWVGKIFYTADSRIDTIAIWPVSFEPGTTQMRRGIDSHAARLATFMRETPAVAFTLKPVMTVEDVDALKREAVGQRLDALARGASQTNPAAIASRLFAERFPGRPVPAEIDAMVHELARQEPSPDAALRALATQRLDLTRRGLESKGVDPARLRTSDGTVPVEASGAGRVEFEMAPLAASAS